MENSNVFENKKIKAEQQANLVTAIIQLNALVLREDITPSDKITALYSIYEFQNAIMDEVEKCIDRVKLL